MKKYLVLLSILFISFTLFSQTEQHAVTVSNVAVQTRVYDGGEFVDSLKIEDFELYEDGVLQNIEALYLTHKTRVARAEERKAYSPRTSRNFFLIFQITDYNPKFDEAFDYLFKEIITPEDTLTIMTPVRNYNLPESALINSPPEKLSKDLRGIVRKDAKVGAANYRSIMRDLKRIVRTISSTGGLRSTENQFTEGSSSLEWLLPRYRESLIKLEQSRITNEKWFLKLAQELRKRPGQKNVFFFYEREFRPEMSTNAYYNIINNYQDKPHILSQVRDLFQFYHRDSELGATRIKQAFADSALDFYFLFMKRKPERSSLGVVMREQSEDVFSTFREVTKATGGIVDSSQNPAAGFKNAMDVCENCYFLYYTPTNPRRTGKFRNIVVRIKNKEYKVKHRQGYFAR